MSDESEYAVWDVDPDPTIDERKAQEMDRARQRALERPHLERQTHHGWWTLSVVGMILFAPVFVPNIGTGTAMELVVATILSYHLVRFTHHRMMVRYYRGEGYPVMRLWNYIQRRSSSIV